MSLDENVYAPPTADLSGPSGPSGGPRYGPYRDTGWRAGMAVVGLATSALTAAAVFFLTPPMTGEADGAVALAVSLAIFVVIISIFTTVSFCMWFHRTYANLRALGVAAPRFTPGWAVGYFFIPILNLIRPFQAAREAWVETEAALAGDTGGHVVERDAGLVSGWWLAWIGMNLVSNFQTMAPKSLRLAADAELLRVVQGVQVALGCVAAGLGIAVVVGLTRRQREAATRRGFPAI